MKNSTKRLKTESTQESIYSPSKNYPRQILPKKNVTQNKNYHTMKVVLLIGPLFHCRPLFIASIARGVGSRTLTARKYLSCAKDFVMVVGWTTPAPIVQPYN